jgi:pimeloyl-ACP methyl ester carboxylesterase
MPNTDTSRTASDLRGVSKLAIAATTAITDLVEAMHHNIASVPGKSVIRQDGRTRGISGLVYSTVRGVTRVVGGGLDAALALVSPALSDVPDVRGRGAITAALNGVMGDYLEDTRNPLAITMCLRQNGQALSLAREALSASLPAASGKIVVLVHGLCMNDLQWNRRDATGTYHDHGAALQRDLGYTPVYLHYNSGLHVSTNGQAFSGLLEELVSAWPVPVEELSLVMHSMGGLVSRSAHHYAGQAKCQWIRALRSMVFLGTPHHGAPLERGGHWIDVILGAAPYAAPLAKLGKVRSAGITDLRYGNLVDDDWQHRDRFAQAPDTRRRIPLPTNVRCFAIAATTGKRDGDLADRVLGDGLVPLKSALGQHSGTRLSLRFPRDRQRTVYATNHMQLLSSSVVYTEIRQMLSR